MAGFFEKIFGAKKETPRQAATEVFQFLRGYTPVFTDFAGEVYESDMIRAALDAGTFSEFRKNWAETLDTRI